jgi:Uma2 family endonuclease
MAAMAQSDALVLRLSYQVVPNLEAWVLPEVPVPESLFHSQTLTYLQALLEAWASRATPRPLVARNLAVRWVERAPRVGIDPDLAVFVPAPPEQDLSSMCTWKPGHTRPRVAIEVVSRNHPYKDYHVVQEKYAALGVPELWVLDPQGFGPAHDGGPHTIQRWQTERDGSFARTYAGTGPAWSAEFGAWLSVTADGTVRICKDEAGTQPWLTEAQSDRLEKEQQRAAKEQEQAAKEQERAAKEQERAAKEQALLRIEQLERELAARG